MTTYIVGPGGNDANSGLNWADRLATLNGAEDKPVVAGDIVRVAPGAYRELLALDVSGTPGSPITYVADLTGENSDETGGIVRITGSDDDQSATRANAITGTTRSYRTFRGFTFDTTTSYVVSGGADSRTNWIIEDCTFQHWVTSALYVSGASQAAWTIRRCVLRVAATQDANSVTFQHVATVDNTGHVIENCIIDGPRAGRGVEVSRVGGVTVRNCIMGNASYAGLISNALSVGQTFTFTGCLLYNLFIALSAPAADGTFVENYNTFYGNSTNRSNVGVGANSVTYPLLFDLGLLHAGAAQGSGFNLPQPRPGSLMPWSQMRAIADGGTNATLDISGLARPATDGKRSWGAVQFQGQIRDVATVRGGAASLKLPDAGRAQFFVPTAGMAITISVYAYREANYAGTAPQMVIKQPGQADRTTTDAGAAAGWNLLTDTFTPDASTDFVVVELVSRNTAAAGSYATYFDDLSVS